MSVSLFRRAACAASACIAATALATGAARAEPAIWVVHGANHATVYLFGTVHALRPTAVWKSPKIDRAFAASSELWLEIADIDNQAAVIPIVQKYGLDPTTPLSSKLDAAYQAKLAAAAQTTGLPPAMLDRMRPWFAGLTLTLAPLLKAGYKADSGAEMVLKAAAVQKHEPVNGFETIEQQLRYFADLPEAMQLAFLKDTLDDTDNAAAKLDEIEKAWEAGDVKKIADVMNGEMKLKAPALYDLLLVKRNQAFAHQIEARLKTPGVAFVAVGAAHLAGAESVQVQLAKDGIRAERF